MVPEALIPFGRSLGVSGEFYFPEAPCDAQPLGKAWWPIDEDRRAYARADGARDLLLEHPPGIAAAREVLRVFVNALSNRHPGVPLVVIGFSQGGMLACDAVLRGAVTASGLVLLSSSRICADEWETCATRLRGLPVLVSHGDRDDDLALHAGEGLRDFCERSGAVVDWLPFSGGHEIPLVVWRGVRRFLRSII